MALILDPIDRKYEQAQLIAQCGAIVSPLIKACECVPPLSSEEKMRLVAKVSPDLGTLLRALYDFARTEPGADYSIYVNGLRTPIDEIAGFMPTLKLVASDAPFFRQRLDDLVKGILSLPVTVDSKIYEAHTPFQTFCFVRTLCATTKHRLDWCDRYFNATLFYRYLFHLMSHVKVTVVTWPAPSAITGKNAIRYREFMDMSKLYSDEHGPNEYRLITEPTFHDRWLRCDDNIYHLGGSAKDLEQLFTVSKVDSTPANHKAIDDLIVTGTEVFGPSQTVHP